MIESLAIFAEQKSRRGTGSSIYAFITTDFVGSAFHCRVGGLAHWFAFVDCKDRSRGCGVLDWIKLGVLAVLGIVFSMMPGKKGD